MRAAPTTPFAPADLVLRVTIAVSASTAAWRAWSGVSAVNGWLFMGLGTSESFANSVEAGAAISLWVASLWLLLRPSALPCALVAAWFALLAFARFQQGGEEFSHLAPIAHAVRYLSPVALWMIRRGQAPRAFGLLRLAIAATFLAHGFEALQHASRFIDILIPSLRRLFDLRVSEAQARTILTVIGCVDVLAALGLFVGRRWWIPLWMLLWGAATMGSRPIAWGWEQWPEAAIRCANAGAPLALLLYWRCLAPARSLHSSHDSQTSTQSPTP